MVTPREHIEQIRTEKFSIGREDNPLIEDLHHAVKHLSAELYTKDVHFLMELLQNAEDNDYPAEVEPSSEFVITNRDITGVGASATLLVLNNEKGFTSNNIESLCSVGRSTKKGKRQGGYIGEKGIGFKSVFLVSRQPYIFSGGYQIRYSEVPPPDTKIGYIVPEWVDDKPSIQDILKVYGGKSLAELPNTVIILPLRDEKVEAVKQQLASIHPEVILFLSKIKKFSVREDSQKRVNTISVSKETAFRSVKDEKSESFILHLSAEENDKSNGECSYYMWRQRFPVKAENRVEGREEVSNWVITLAFPRDERVTTTRNKVSAGIYAFLPTEMVTGFPFIIQADFLLVSSRESIRWDDKWNKGILDCIPSAFCSAFLFLVKSVESAPPSSRSYCFDKYLPICPPSYAQLGSVRDSIQKRLSTQELIVCERQNAYCTPLQARRIVSSFRDILQKSTEEGMEKPNALWSTGIFIIHSCMDNLVSLKFLGVQYVTYDWYSICIANTSGWVHGFSEDLYVQLLCFVAEYWRERGIRANLQNFPLFKYHNEDYFCNFAWISLCDISASCEKRVYFSNRVEDIEWFIRWNKELRSMASYKFIPIATLMAMKNLGAHQWASLQRWLNAHAKITELSISNFIEGLIEKVHVSNNKKFVVRVAQFLHFTSANNFIHSKQMQGFCSSLPVLTDSGSIVGKGQTKLVPAAIGKWAMLMGNNRRWAAQGAAILSDDYLQLPSCAVRLSGGGPNFLRHFFTNGLRAVDIPDLKPPNAAVSGFPFSIGQEEAIILLQWIQHLVVTSGGSLPKGFKRIVMEGKWLKTHTGYQSPTMSFLLDDEWKYAGLQSNDLSFIDSTFYGNSMGAFKIALEHIGVVVKFGDGCEIVAKQLELHTDLKVITRLYKYLHRFNWTPNDEDTVKIWIPHDGGLGGVWKDTEMCVIHDYTGIFKDKLQVLEQVYENALLPFFSNHLGVRRHPIIEDYCNLWMTWSCTNHPVTESECCSVWEIILKNWRLSPSTIKTNMGTRGLKFPTYTNFGGIQLSAPNETFLPDHLTLAELFKRNSARIKFAWHPNPSNPEVPLDSLFSMYKSLGARNISEAALRNEVAVPNEISLHKLEAGEGLFRKGLHRIILAYLAYTSFKIPVYRRHQIVRTILGSPAYETSEPLTVSYTLAVRAEDGKVENIVATAPSFVRWEKANNRILIHKSDPHNQKARLSLATEFAEVVSKGLLSEYPHLVAGLSKMLKIGCILGFDDEVVNEILQHSNFQLFEEDLSYLLSLAPKQNDTILKRGFLLSGFNLHL